MFKGTQITDSQRSEYLQSLVLCALEPWHFFTNYVNVRVPGYGTVKFEPWTHQRQLLALHYLHDRVIVLKARQIGVSWLYVGIGLHNCLFIPASNNLYFSKGEDAAADLQKRSRFIWEHLPPWMKFPKGADNNSLLEFPLLDSKIQSFPDTGSGGRGESSTFVFLDELAFQKNARETYSAIEPAAEFGKIVGVSTANGKDNLYYEIYEQAITGESDFYPVFIPYTARPGRSPDFLKNAMRRMPKYMALQEYPLYRQDAFLVSGECMFDISALHDMPIESPHAVFTDEDTPGVTGYIYRPPEGGHSYVAAIDPARGGNAKRDYSCLQIIDSETGHQVAILRTQRELDQFMPVAYALLQHYGHPHVAPEEQGQGYYAIKYLLEPPRYRNGKERQPYPRPRMHYRSKNTPGWHTTPSLRDLILGNLEIAIRSGRIAIHDQDTIDECLGFGYHEKENKYMANSGHDDTVMSMALAWHMTGRGEKKADEYQPISYITKTNMRDVDIWKALDWSNPDLHDAAQQLVTEYGEPMSLRDRIEAFKRGA